MDLQDSVVAASKILPSRHQSTETSTTVLLAVLVLFDGSTSIVIVHHLPFWDRPLTLQRQRAVARQARSIPFQVLPHTQIAPAVLVPDSLHEPPASAWRAWRQRPTAGLAQQALGTQRTGERNSRH
ncbi:hypothetical protein TGAM01_v201832 [Trichoderma gamsii]|uniref:Uncharacterized protein n=1 Tax=Trichoderma gamsii TaxID=398673 RepID=A0A2P4ZZA1_9HYPO|nr:hypothetical protein TGAM01_v201832 [Trichoderma gamsii]PON29583.1 hypothetical protein TGAM01_v201832 [Trichoderma gamsii]